MEQWEYMGIYASAQAGRTNVVVIAPDGQWSEADTGFDMGSAIVLINSLGREGWQLVSTDSGVEYEPLGQVKRQTNRYWLQRPLRQ